MEHGPLGGAVSAQVHPVAVELALNQLAISKLGNATKVSIVVSVWESSFNYPYSHWLIAEKWYIFVSGSAKEEILTNVIRTHECKHEQKFGRVL